jgi:DNA-binding response OmpR family regulator
MSARPILIIEDDDEFREVLTEQLDTVGEFQVTVATTLGQATQFLRAENARFDAIILDINLPDGDGCDFCAELRENGCKAPVIMLTGASAETDVVRGFEAGANDYVRKPFRAKELIARIQTQLRMFDNSVDAVFTIGSFTFRPSAKLLVQKEKNKRIALTAKEVDILKLFHKSGDRTVTRQTLLEKVFGYKSDISTHTLETHIYRLRQKIEVNNRDCQLLITMPGGYRLAQAA